MEMWFKKYFILFFVLILISDFASAQLDSVKTDSTTFIRILNPIPNEASLTDLCTG